MLNEVVMLTSKQPCEGGKPYVITKILDIVFNI